MLQLFAVCVFACVLLGVLGAYARSQKRSLTDIIRGGDSGRNQRPTEIQKPSFLERFEQSAKQAGLAWNRQTYRTFVTFGAAGGLVLALAGQGLLGAGLFLVATVGPYCYVAKLQAQRRQKFLEQLPGALFMAASVLRAGGTLMQAVDAIAAEMPDPIGGEFKRVQEQMRLQVPAHEALAEAYERIGLREFAAVVVTARITAEVGGNLAHLYDQVARAIIDSQNARRTILAFTTEGRMSANLITALPFVVMGILQVLSPGYFQPLFENAAGIALLSLCVGMIAMGWWIIRRMVDIRIF